jgi:hypothetical protein
MRAYFVRVFILLIVVATVVFVAHRLIGLTPVAGDAAGGVLGILALVVAVAGSYVVHWRTVRCPRCERWSVPLGINGFAPRTCPRCQTQLR